tara:strand:- start:3249 stop:5537 length:2289 start_codon:yes stop_codon:yes gene_type:complete
MSNYDNSNQYERFVHALTIWLPNAKIKYLSEKQEKEQIEYCIKQLKTYHLHIELYNNDKNQENAESQSQNKTIEICAMTRQGYFIICGKSYVWPFKEVFCQNWIYKNQNGTETWSCDLQTPWEIYKGRLKLLIHQNTICVEGQYNKGKISLLQFIEYHNIENLMKYLQNYSIDKNKYLSLLNGPWRNKKNNPLENHPYLPHLKSKCAKALFLSLMIVNLLDPNISYANTNDIYTKRIIGVEWLIGHLCSRITDNACSYMIKRIHTQGQLINLNSYFECISHLTRVIRGSPGYGNFKKREYDNSHIGVYCLYRSSEGENIGLTVDLVSDVKITLPQIKFDIISKKIINGIIDDTTQIFSPESKNWIFLDGGRVIKGSNLSKGYVAEQLIFSRHMPPVRSSYATTHIRQANQLIYPQKPIITSKDANKIIMNGCNAIVAVSGYGGWNIEDAIVVNESFINRGGLHSMHKKTTIVKKTGKEIWKNPVHHARKKIKESDISFTKSKNNVDHHIRGCYGTVKNSYITTDSLSAILELEYIHKPEIGDKLSTRSGQKGVIGYIESTQNMPHTLNGIVPDIIINPAHLPSRMTVSQMLESYFGTEAVVSAKLRYDDISEIEISKLNKTSGKCNFICGKTGKRLDNPLFIGTVYYLALHHLVHKKIKARNIGPVINITGQPNKGGKLGGLRIGEMERDSIMARNGIDILKDRLQTSSDLISVRVCKTCGWLSPEIACCENYNWINIKMSRTTKLALMEMYALKIFPKLHF